MGVFVRRVIYMVCMFCIVGKVLSIAFGGNFASIAATSDKGDILVFAAIVAGVIGLIGFIFHKIYVWCCGGKL